MERHLAGREQSGAAARAVPHRRCEERAGIIDEIGSFPKAKTGYALDRAASAAACKLPACMANGEIPSAQHALSRHTHLCRLRAGDEVPCAGLRGWRAASSFNAASARVFATLELRPAEPLLLVFGGASAGDMLRNWVLHARRLGMTFVVACMDEALFELSDLLRAGQALLRNKRGAQSVVTTRWKYYRMDPKAFMAMGILKVRFFVEFMRAGFDVLCSDLDVIWLRDPREWLMGTAPNSGLLTFADVVVSTE